MAALDVTDADAGDLIVAERARAIGRLDVLVNNAGTSFAKPPEELSDDDWQGQFDLNVMAPMRLMRAAAPRMAEAGWGRIVNVTSSAGKRPSLTNVAYAATKAAQLSLVARVRRPVRRKACWSTPWRPGRRHRALDGRGRPGRPGRRAKGITREEALEEAGKIPLGPLGHRRRIAACRLPLLRRASKVTGAAWSADGGTVII